MNNNSEKKHENLFRFGVYQNDSLVIERSFSADDYNQGMRYYVDIRDKVSGIISKLSRTLSRQNLTYNIFDYDNLKEYNKRLKGAKDQEDNKLLKPEEIYFRKGNNGEFKGAEFKFVLFVNEHTIVERTFGVENYNPASRFSRELTDVVKYIVEDIIDYLKKSDRNHMWDDKSIISIYNLNISQIRDLSRENRNLLLKNIDQIDFVKKIKKQYRTNVETEINDDMMND